MTMDYQAILNSMPSIGVVAHWPDGLLAFANGTATQWWPGLATLVEQKWDTAAAWIARHCGQRDRVLAALTQNRIRSSALEVLTARGAPGPAMLLANRHKGPEGLVIWTFTDATQLAVAKRALDAQSARLEAIMDHAPIPIRGFDQQRRVIHWNKASEALYGYPGIGIRGQAMEQVLVPAEARAQTAEQWDEMLSGATLSATGESVFVTANGSKVMVQTSHVLVPDLPDGPEVYALDVDVTDRVHREHQLRSKVFRDGLTGLPNRAAMQKKLLTLAAENKLFSLCFIDLNGFKGVNDTHGHAIGDKLLVVTARRLVHGLRPDDRLYRLGGDEFVIVLPGSDLPGAHTVIQRFKKAFALPLQIGELNITVGLSVGISEWPKDGRDLQDLLKVADERMYDEKRATGSRRSRGHQAA